MMRVTREAYVNYLGAADDDEIEDLGSRLTLEARPLRSPVRC